MGLACRQGCLVHGERRGDHPERDQPSVLRRRGAVAVIALAVGPSWVVEREPDAPRAATAGARERAGALAAQHGEGKCIRELKAADPGVQYLLALVALDKPDCELADRAPD